MDSVATIWKNQNERELERRKPRKRLHCTDRWLFHQSSCCRRIRGPRTFRWIPLPRYGKTRTKGNSSEGSHGRDCIALIVGCFIRAVVADVSAGLGPFDGFRCHDMEKPERKGTRAKEATEETALH